jgi:hypothetical protein
MPENTLSVGGAKFEIPLTELRDLLGLPEDASVWYVYYRKEENGTPAALEVSVTHDDLPTVYGNSLLEPPDCTPVWTMQEREVLTFQSWGNGDHGE